MSSDTYFQLVVILTLPAAIFYPLIYGTQTRWWRDWIGRALLVKAVGLAILIGFTAAFQIFGPDYYARDFIRNAGITLVCIGVWLALTAMLRALFQRRPTA